MCFFPSALDCLSSFLLVARRCIVREYPSAWSCFVIWFLGLPASKNCSFSSLSDLLVSIFPVPNIVQSCDLLCNSCSSSVNSGAHLRKPEQSNFLWREFHWPSTIPSGRYKTKRKTYPMAETRKSSGEMYSGISWCVKIKLIVLWHLQADYIAT